MGVFGIVIGLLIAIQIPGIPNSALGGCVAGLGLGILTTKPLEK